MPLWSLWLLGWSGFTCYLRSFEDFPGGSDAKASVYNAGDLGSSPGLGRSPGEGNGNPLQYYCLENPMDRGAWWATIHGVAESWTQLSTIAHSTIFILVPNWKSSNYPRVEWIHWDLSMDINYIVMKMNSKDESCKHKTE